MPSPTEGSSEALATDEPELLVEELIRVTHHALTALLMLLAEQPAESGCGVPVDESVSRTGPDWTARRDPKTPKPVLT
jgi:hypothetical protein